MYILLLIFVACCIFFLGPKSKSTKNYPPGPLCLPLIGNMWALGTNTFRMHVAVANLAKKWGPVYRLQIGSKPFVVITDPEIIKETFGTMDSPALLRFVSKTVEKIDRGQSLFFALERRVWVLLRKVHAPLARNVLGAAPISEIITQEVAKLLSELDKRVGQEVHLNPMFMFFARNNFLYMALRQSWSFDTEDEEEKQFSYDMMATLDNLTSLFDFFPSLDFLRYKSAMTTYRHSRKIDNFVKKILEKRRKDPLPSEGTARDLLDVLLLEQAQNPDFSEDALVFTFRDTLFAATATTADSLDWAMLFLCDHQDVQEKCHKEITEQLDGRPPTMADQAKMPYLNSVIKETLRMRPPAPFSIPHLAERDCTIGGYHVEKGSIVIENVYGIGNSDKFYKNSSAFDPERWLRDADLPSNMPFGVGPTTCLGMPIANQELFLGIASLVQRYKFKYGPSSPVPDFVGEYKLAFNAKEWHAVLLHR